MEEYVYTVVEDVKDEVKKDAVLTLNEHYNNSDQCDYVLPVSERIAGRYTVVKNYDPKEAYHDITYAV